MKKKVLVLLLTFFFSAAFLMPITFILSSASHEHDCCTIEIEDESTAPVVKYLCCVVCLNVHNAKYSFLTCVSDGGAGAFSMRHGFYNPAPVGSVYVHICTTLISLSVRMDN